MKKLSFAEGTEQAAFIIPGIRIHDCTRLLGVEEAESERQTLVLKRSDVRALTVSFGKSTHEGAWQRGSMVVLPSGMHWGSAPKSPYSVSIFAIDNSKFVDAAMDVIDYDNIDFRFTDVGRSGASEIAEAIRNMAVTGLAEKYPIMSETMTLALAAETIRNLSPGLSDRMMSVKNGLSVQRKRRVMDFIHDNVGNLISLSDIASVAGLSAYHFSRSFKASVGMSPSKYMIHLRIGKAKRLIAGGMPLSQVAYDCLFASQSHMTTLFRRDVGITPAEYQRLVR